VSFFNNFLRVVRSDFYANLVIGRVFNSKFYKLVYFYFFVLRSGVSRYLNITAVANSAKRFSVFLNLQMVPLRLILKLTALSVSFILFFFCFA
jgi:hypothetical protein